MNKREFDAEIKRLNNNIESAYKARTRITKEFQENCPHHLKYLRCESNDQQDEYGRWIDSWTTYTYSCTRCGAYVDRIKPKQFTTDKEVRDALKAKVETTK